MTYDAQTGTQHSDRVLRTTIRRGGVKLCNNLMERSDCYTANLYMVKEIFGMHVVAVTMPMLKL
jgi:hypothetical protein